MDVTNRNRAIRASQDFGRGEELRLAIIGEPGEKQLERLTYWIRQAADSVASVYGRFPQPHTQVLVVPIGPRSEPVPWAHVVRGGGVGVELFVDETRPLRQHLDDWTATHELSHLFLPYVAYQDRWLSEGLASYYQNVLRARDGRLSAREAWQNLHSGLQRGRAATRSGTLTDELRAGRAPVMRVYWSGVAMMLKADARLRALTAGEQSLDTALAALQDCCLDPSRRWTARDLFAELDRISGTGIFLGLYRAHLPDDEFPDLSGMYRQLGLNATGGRIRLEPDAGWRHIRDGIMSGVDPDG